MPRRADSATYAERVERRSLDVAPLTRPWHHADLPVVGAEPSVDTGSSPRHRVIARTLRSHVVELRRRFARVRSGDVAAALPIELARRWVRAHPRRRRIGRHDLPGSTAGWADLSPIGFRQHGDGTVHDARDLDVQRRRDRRRATAAQMVAVDASEVTDDEVSSGIVQLGLLGAPLVARHESCEGVAGGFVWTLASVDSSDMSDRLRREMHSVSVRRAARREAERRGVLTAWRPSVSVVLATNRPDDLDHALRCLQRQSIAPAEVLVGFHGSGWTADDERRVHDVLECATEVVRCDATMNLGQVLNELSSRAACELLTKWDDDDWYGPHHLEDLVDALGYSGADLVGKAAEFVRLETTDLTIRRFVHGAETYSTTLAGGTLICRRATLESVGGWARVPRHVDRKLIDAITGSGGTIYRTHGFEYLLRRRAGQHTWSADDGYFLRQASDVRAGLDVAFSGVDG